MDANVVTQFGDQLTASAVIVFLINALKKASWFPWLNAQTDKLNRAVALVFSGLAALGIHTSHTWSASSGVFVLTVKGLTLAGILAAAWAWLKSFAVQEFVYRATRGNGAPAAPAPKP